MTPTPADYAFFRGVVWGLLLSAPFWVSFLLLILLFLP